MPFDGFLFASRVMIAKEAHASSSVKDLIVAAPGVDDTNWDPAQREANGVVGGTSSRAETIKKLNADFVKPWFGWKKD
jgi:fatty acid synthase subunit alpha